jgi:hypothetical protein
MEKDVIPVINGLFSCLVAGAALLPDGLPADTAGVRRPEGSTRYFQAQLANDIYQRTDRYYTGGGVLRYAAPGLRYAPLRRLLPALPGTPHRTHGVEFVLDVFTPADISVTEVQRDDRPYAGYWYAGSFLQSEHPGRGMVLRTAVHLGVLGPPAAAGRVQTAIHQLIQCPSPAGWGHQVRADVVLDYQVQFRKRLLAVGRVLEAGSLAEVRAGTLYDQLRTGATLRVGKWRPRRGAPARPDRGFRCFGAWEGQLTGVGYNATLQGGVFNRNSPYALSPGRVIRLVWGHTAGAVIGWGRVGIAFGQTWLGREFSGGKAHCWNYLSIRVEER